MAGFKTAYDQREIILDADVVGDCKVGDVVKLTVATSTVSAYIQKSTFANGTHIIAQSDYTQEYGHIPVENVDYKYSDKVAKTVTAAPTTKTKTVKKVALYKIIDKEDVILDADGGDVA